MTTPKATLEEMAEACQFQADLRYGQLAIRATYYPDRAPDELVRHDAFVFERAADVLRHMAMEPDESRKFIVGLMERHR